MYLSSHAPFCFPHAKENAVLSLSCPPKSGSFILILLRGLKHFHAKCTGFVKTSADFCEPVATVQLMINHLLLLEGGVSWVCHHARMLKQEHRLCSQWHDAYCIPRSKLCTENSILLKQYVKQYVLAYAIICIFKQYTVVTTLCLILAIISNKYDNLTFLFKF